MKSKYLIKSPVGWMWYCPACETYHQADLTRGWTFDSNHDAPTFSPSFLCRYHWGEDRVEKRCHTFVRNGKIEYLSDCTHEYAGKTIDMVPEEEWDRVTLAQAQDLRSEETR